MAIAVLGLALWSGARDAVADGHSRLRQAKPAQPASTPTPTQSAGPSPIATATRSTAASLRPAAAPTPTPSPGPSPADPLAPLAERYFRLLIDPTASMEDLAAARHALEAAAAGRPPSVASSAAGPGTRVAPVAPGRPSPVRVPAAAGSR